MGSYRFYVDCEGSRHSIIWRPGLGVVAESHDADREFALLALGGDATGCIDVLSAWSQVRNKPPTLSLMLAWTNPDIEPTQLEAVRATEPLRQAVERLILGATLPPKEQWTRAVVLSLPVEARRRLVSDALDALEASVGQDPDASAMRAEIFGRRSNDRHKSAPE